VRVVSADPLVADMTAAWARSLGARIVENEGDLAIHDDLRLRRTMLKGHGRLAEAAVEVFQAIRRGVFDDIDPIPSTAARVAA
jgi:hypothetical protein